VYACRCGCVYFFDKDNILQPHTLLEQLKKKGLLKKVIAVCLQNHVVLFIRKEKNGWVRRAS